MLWPCLYKLLPCLYKLDQIHVVTILLPCGDVCTSWSQIHVVAMFVQVGPRYMLLPCLYSGHVCISWTQVQVCSRYKVVAMFSGHVCTSWAQVHVVAMF